LVRASRSDLLLWLTNRVRMDALDVVGNSLVGAHWGRLRR
jgi:hypothetical protein